MSSGAGTEPAARHANPDPILANFSVQRVIVALAHPAGAKICGVIWPLPKPPATVNLPVRDAS